MVFLKCKLRIFEYSQLTYYNSTCGDVAKWPKAAVCKTAIPRFESGRRLRRGGGKADAGDLKSPGTKSHAGSSPAPGKT